MDHPVDHHHIHLR